MPEAARAVSGIDLTFDDEAASDIPDSSPPAFTTGSYRPEDYYVPVETEIYPSPAPAGPYTTLLSAFDGTNPNGTWSLVCHRIVYPGRLREYRRRLGDTPSLFATFARFRRRPGPYLSHVGGQQWCQPHRHRSLPGQPA